MAVSALVFAAVSGCVIGAPAASPMPAATAGPSATQSPSLTRTPVHLDGSWFLYQWFQEGKNTKDLFLARPDGSDAHPIITDVPGTHVGGAWSPDGTRIAFSMFDAKTPDGSVWTANADGSGATLLWRGGDACVAVAWPSWSPDGTKLATVCWPDYTGHSSIITLDLSSMAVTTIATFLLPEAVDHPPRWSPDGASIAFPILDYDQPNDHLNGSLVAVAPAVGGSLNRLTTMDTFMSSPDWRPDGLELVMNSHDLRYVQATAQPSNLYAIKPDGTGLRQLTHSSVDGSLRITMPRWKADGSAMIVSIATSVAANMSVDCVKPGILDPAGGEPVAWAGPCGAAAELRPMP